MAKAFPVRAPSSTWHSRLRVVKKSGSWFTYEGDQLGQGRENVRQFLKDNPAITEEIGNKVKAEFGLIEVPISSPKMSQQRPRQRGCPCRRGQG